MLRWFKRRQSEDTDVEEELRAHLAIEAEAQRERGVDAKDADMAARRELGNVTRVREQVYAQSRWMLFETLAADFRYGLRLLRKTPVWSGVVAATLIFGIALTTATFSLVYSLLLQPLPYPEPEQLVTIWTLAPKANYPRLNASPANWKDWHERNHVFTDIGIVQASLNYNLTASGGEPERIRVARISASLLPILGVRPMLGRSFTAEERSPCTGSAGRTWSLEAEVRFRPEAGGQKNRIE